MSADEPGYVPPDHKTTAEFRLPDRSPFSPPAEEATAVDHPLPDDRDELDQTVADPVPDTATDLTADDWQNVAELPADDVPEDFPADGSAAEEERKAQGAAAAGAVPADEPGEWTKMFGSEDDSGQASSLRSEGLTGGASASPLAAAAVPPAATGPDVPQVPQESPHPEAPAAASPLPPPGAPQGPDPTSPDVQTPVGAGMPAGAGQFAASTTPMGSPGAPQPTGPSRGGSRTPLVVAAVVALVLVVAAGVAAMTLLSGDDETGGPAAGPTAPAGGTPASPGADGSGAPAPGQGTPGVAPGGAVDPGDPSQGGTPMPEQGAPTPTPPPRDPIGPVLRGKGVTYMLVQHDPGYYEGLLIITNRGDKPMKEWTITFEAPNATVKNIWGGELVRGGEHVKIRNLEGAPEIPPGGTWEVRFGAEGSPVEPVKCRFNGRGCGLE